MKHQRFIYLAVPVLLILIVSNLLNFTVATTRFNQSYPDVVCPPNTEGLTTAISLTSSKTQVRKTGSQSLKTYEVGFRRYAVAAQSAVIESEEVTPIVWQTRTGVWAGAMGCSAPSTSQWFVGATADITSKGSLHLVNSGLGRAFVEISIYSEQGEIAPRTFNIKANTYISIRLASLAPGSKRIAIHVLTRSGRVNGFVVDERAKGLKALGGDLVNPTPAPQTSITIPAIPQNVTRRGPVGHTLRLLVPGDVNARISAEVRSKDGTFAPAGINGRVIKNKRVTEIPLNIEMAKGNFALRISSDQPLVAAVYSSTSAQGKKDFIWSTAADELTPFTLATSGVTPTLVFTGREIKLQLELLNSKGSAKKIVITGQDIATYVVPDGVRGVSFSRISRGTSGAALIASKSGYGYLPLNAGSVLTKSSVPTSNIQVLNP
jgi:hypothetical protein